MSNGVKTNGHFLNVGNPATWVIKGKEVSLSVERVTPEMAAEWLSISGGGNFRKMNLQRASRYRDVMKSGGWDFNGATVVFDSSGNIVDGQKRLKACADSGVPLLTIVVRGLDAFMNYDRPELRTLAQLLAHKGEVRVHALAAAIRTVWDLRHGNYMNRQPVEISDLVKLFESNPKIVDSVAVGVTARKIMPGSMLSGVHYVASSGGYPEEATLFIHKINDGDELSSGDPVYLLRQRMIADAGAKARLMPVEKMALLITAWNAWVAGKSIGKLSWNSVGPKAQPFPVVLVKGDE